MSFEIGTDDADVAMEHVTFDYIDWDFSCTNLLKIYVNLVCLVINMQKAFLGEISMVYSTLELCKGMSSNFLHGEWVQSKAS